MALDGRVGGKRSRREHPMAAVRRRALRQVRPRLLGGGSVASIISRRAGEPTAATASSTSPAVAAAEAAGKYAAQREWRKGDSAEMRATAGGAWHPVRVVDVRRAARGAPQHLLVGGEDGSKRWLDLSRSDDAERIHPVEGAGTKAAPLATGAGRDAEAAPAAGPEGAATKAGEGAESPGPEEDVPVEIVGGMTVECFRPCTQRWETAIIESIDPESDVVVVAWESSSEKRGETITLLHGDKCLVRSVRGGPISLRGIVYDSTRRKAGGAAEESELTEYAAPVGRTDTEASFWGAKDTYSATGGKLNELQLDTNLNGFKWSNSMLGTPNSPVNQLRRSNTCAIAVEGADTGDAEQRPWYEDHTSARYKENSNWASPQEQHECVDPVDQIWEPDFRGWTTSGYSSLQGGVQGLANLGNTCYLNSVLQALAHCGPLVESLLVRATPKAGNKRHRLVTAFLQMLQRQWLSGAETAFRPLLIKNLMGKASARFIGNKQHDAQEILVFILDALHEELNVAEERKYAEIKDTPEMGDVERSQLWWDNYSACNHSLIKDLFVGQVRSRIMCRVCEYTSTTFDPFWSLSVPLSAQSDCTLEQCFSLFCKPEMLAGDNKYACPRCKELTESTKCLSLFRCPPVLVVHIKRFQVRADNAVSKLCCPVTIPTDALDLRPYCAAQAHAAADGSAEPLAYDLSAIVNHLGASGSHGHYTTHSFEPVRNTWYHFDDSSVTPMECVNKSAAYILFYIRKPV